MKPLKYITIICFLLFINKELIAQTDTAQKISLHLNNASYLTLVKNIESQTEFHFFYDTALFAS